MKRIERGIAIAAPPEEVFAFLADLERIGEWQTDVVSARRTSAGPIARGATAIVRRTVAGQLLDVPITVTEHEPPNRLSIESTVSGVRARAVINLTAVGAQRSSHLDFALEIRGSMLSAFLEPVIAHAAATEIDASLERIRHRFEGSPEGTP